MTTYTHAIPLEHNLEPGPLWPYKHTEKELAVLEKANPYIYSCQQCQDPMVAGGATFKREWWEFYDVVPDYLYKAIFCDTAMKDKEENDYTVFQCWAKYKNRIYLLDQYRARIESVLLEQAFLMFWNKHNTSTIQPLTRAYIEDKVSGTTLIQQIQKVGGIPVVGIPRHKSKVERARNLCPWIESGYVVLPTSADWLYDYTLEFEKFTPLMTHKHDDQIDPTLDAIQEMLIKASIEEFTGQTLDNKSERNLAPPLESERMW